MKLPSETPELFGKLIRIGRKQNGASWFTRSLDDKDFCDWFDRGEIVFVVGPYSNFAPTVFLGGDYVFSVVLCLSMHGLVWATPDGFRDEM